MTKASQRLKVIQEFISDCGYEAEVEKNEEFSILSFTIDNIITNYDGMEPVVNLAFSDNLMNVGKAECDILQLYVGIGFSIPLGRLSQIQRFCSDVNKIIQIGYFGTDFSEGNFFYQYAQPVAVNITEEAVRLLMDGAMTQIVFYFALFYDVFLDLVSGQIGYEQAAAAVEQKSQRLQKVVAETFGGKK